MFKRSDTLFFSAYGISYLCIPHFISPSTSIQISASLPASADFIIFKLRLMRRKNDILWKGILEEVFPELLRFLFPDAESRFNMKRKVTLLDKEMAEMYPEPHKKSDTRFVDKLVKVYTTAGTARYLLIHIEVQGQYDKEFTKRMFTYFYRIYDRFLGQPVIPIAIFTGPDGTRMGDRF